MLISAISCLVHSPESYAQSVQNQAESLDVIAFAPSAVWMAQMKNQLLNSKFELSQKIDQYHYATQDESIQFVSERVNFDTHFKTNVISSSNEVFQLALQLDQAAILLSNFNLVATIKKDLGFGTATLKLDMHCDAITLNLKNNNPVLAEVKAESGKFNVSQLTWNLRNTEIKTQLSGCKEVAGFDQLLKDQIQQNIEQSLVIESLQQLINEKLNPIVNEKINNELQSYIQKFKVAMQAKHQIDSKNNLWIYSGASLDQSFTTSEIQQIQASTKPALLVKKRSLELFTKKALNDILNINTLSSHSFDDMKRLTCSRFIQTFIWPSLKSLNKCFEMKIQSQIQSLTITDLSTLDLSLKVGAWASGEGHQIAYFESDLSASLTQGKILMNSFSGRAIPEFINWSGRSKRISTGMIQPALQSLLDATVAKVKNNSVLKLIQQNTRSKLLSPDTIFVELNF